MRRTLLLLAMLAAFPGCTTMMTDAQEFWSQSKRAMVPSASDYQDGSTDEGEEWEFVGKEARGNEPKEREVDRWWWENVMSPQARSIERNLGYE